MPILQLGISGDGLSEAQLNDYATNFIRTQLITIPGAVVQLKDTAGQLEVLDQVLVVGGKIAREVEVLLRVEQVCLHVRIRPFSWP